MLLESPEGKDGKRARGTDLVQRWAPTVEAIPEGTATSEGDQPVRSQGLLDSVTLSALSLVAGMLIASPYLVLAYLVYALL